MRGLKQLLPAVVLILAASAALLLSDLKNRQSAAHKATTAKPSIALLQNASTQLQDDHVKGTVEALRAHGCLEDDEHNLHRYNSQGDFATANAIAREMVNGDFDILITCSTIALQVVAKANEKVKKNHVFGTVTYPQGAGVGIVGTNPDQHPPYLAGIGTFQPVKRTFEIARELNPRLAVVGVVWNPGEKCSEQCLLEARNACRTLGIKLIEATATGTSEVSDALRSLLTQQVEALWIGGDTVAISALSLIARQAGLAGIPVFTNDPTDVGKGALFGLGADYVTVGRYTGEMAAEILHGKSPAEYRITNVVPEMFMLNRKILSGLAPNWKMTDSLTKLEKHDAVNNTVAESKKLPISPGGVLDLEEVAKQKITVSAEVLLRCNRFSHAGRARNRPAVVAIVNLVTNPLLDQAEKGVEAGLQELGFQPGEDYVIKPFNANGDMSQLPQMLDAAMALKPDLIVTVTTPALAAAVRKVKEIPLVFTSASDPEKMGLLTHGRPANLCGIHDDPPVDKLLDMMLRYDQNLKVVGTIYDPGQINAEISVKKLRKAAKSRNLTLTEVTASGIGELSLSVQALARRGAQAIVVSADNLTATGFPAIVKAASVAGIPIFATEPSLVKQGATGAIGDDYYLWGKKSGILAGRILAGLTPDKLPIEPTTENIVVEPRKEVSR